MAKEKFTGNAAAEVTETPAAKVEKVAKFPIETLRKDCVKLYGISTSTFDGAMFGKSGEYSIEEARTLIENWKKEVVQK